MSGLEFHPRRAWRALWAPTAAASPPEPHSDTSPLKAAYVAHVDRMKTAYPGEDAMEWAVGGGFEQFGMIEAALLKHYGLGPEHYVVDVGCGSGRLAKPLSAYLTGRYLGVDLVPDLIAHARQIVRRPDWRFEVIDHIEIPEADGVADMVCFFSVMTHLLHEQSFWYLEEARRVLRPGGKIVFSFLEFREPGHMPIFWNTLKAAKQRFDEPLNVFMDRDGIQRFADALSLEVVEINPGGAHLVPEGNLGQSLCVLRKP